jgi:hypothetical protein
MFHERVGEAHPNLFSRPVVEPRWANAGAASPSPASAAQGPKTRREF